MNEPQLLHLNNLLVSKTRIDHISNLQLKNVSETWKSGFGLEPSMNLGVDQLYQFKWTI